MNLEVNGKINYKCPGCHANEPLARGLSEAPDVKVMLKDDDIVGIRHNQLVLANNQKLSSGELAGKKAKVLFIHHDICGKCGKEYIFMVDLKEVEISKPVYRSGEKKLIMPSGPLPPMQLPGRGN